MAKKQQPTNQLKLQKTRLRDALLATKFKTTATQILEWAGTRLQRTLKLKQRPSDNYIFIVILLLSLALGLLISLLHGETHIEKQQIVHLEILGISLTLAILPTLKRLSTDFMQGLGPKIVQSIRTKDDLLDFENLLVDTFQRKRRYAILVLLWMILSLFNPLYGASTTDEITGLGSNFFALLINIPCAIGIYYVAFGFVLPHRISNYKFFLYPTNPGRSDLIRSFADTLNIYLFFSAVFISLITWIAIISGHLSIGGYLTLLVGAWAPLILIFSITHFSLRKIIKAHKNEFLAMIEEDATRLQLLKGTVARDDFLKLESLHKEILSSPNSMINFQSILRLVGSLLLQLLPLIVQFLLESYPLSLHF